MKIRLYTKGKEITKLVDSLTWSGDSKQVARKIEFAILQNPKDKNIPVVELTCGDDVVMTDQDNRVLFGGVIYDVDKKVSTAMISITAFDLLFYINQSEISKIFDGTPESITKEICNELGIPIGSIEETGIQVYYPCLGKSAYEAIMIAYTEASKQNEGVYILIIKDTNKLCVIQKGQYCGVVLEGTYNLKESSYTVSAENVVNKVLITDKDGNAFQVIEDMTSRNKYGTIQKVYKQEDDKDAGVEAKALLHGLDETASVDAIGDVRALSGYSLAIQESISGLYGLFFIDSDTHKFENGNHSMNLKVAFKNVMDSKEAEKG